MIASFVTALLDTADLPSRRVRRYAVRLLLVIAVLAPVQFADGAVAWAQRRVAAATGVMLQIIERQIPLPAPPLAPPAATEPKRPAEP